MILVFVGKNSCGKLAVLVYKKKQQKKQKKIPNGRNLSGNW